VWAPEPVCDKNLADNYFINKTAPIPEHHTVRCMEDTEVKPQAS